jgi:hypothetical protein
MGPHSGGKPIISARIALRFLSPKFVIKHRVEIQTESQRVYKQPLVNRNTKGNIILLEGESYFALI